MLDKVNLTAHGAREVHTFSGGMKQRFGIAQALLGNPKLIIVDEPTAGLDPEERNRLNNLLGEISEEIVVILSTHLVTDVYHLCSQMAIMQHGEVLITGEPGRLIAKLNGKLWTKAIDRSTLSDYASRYTIISEQLIAKKLHITVFSTVPLTDFQLAEPTLEHVYFTYLHTFEARL
ncbi:hypothetical protein GCM10023231_01770 [Olivibacter ginsenosidimutans]|uniref:ABC transporter domain-containing protein n=1 Tax=Olivibacter ginsenosidimutans TaxID=1176537 RepID=A0ABP9AEG3_9SPHI